MGCANWWVWILNVEDNNSKLQQLACRGLLARRGLLVRPGHLDLLDLLDSKEILGRPGNQASKVLPASVGHAATRSTERKTTRCRHCRAPCMCTRQAACRRQTCWR